jgi:hypothetical protein
MENFNLRKYLAENKLLKEYIDFPEMEEEFEGAMDVMVVEPEVYLQDIINASPEEIVSDDYYEIMNAVEQGVYSAEEAVELAKSWAKEKLTGLSENKLLKEEKTFDVYNDGGEPVLVNLDKATPSQEKLIRWEMPEITDPETSEEAQEIANEIMQLNSAEDVKQYYGYKRGWFSSSLKDMVGDAMVAYNDVR